MDHVIKTHKLSRTYNGIQALNEVSIQVPHHAIVGFLGPNGAGKTTAMRLLLGLIRPTSGTATIFGLDSVRDSLQIRRRVGYLAQQPRFYEYMSVRETLELTAKLFFNETRSRRNQRVDDALALVDLSGKADRKVKGLSGGELQRLGIAQAQINEPDLLILDEPVAALDPMGRLAVLKIMESLRERTTIFFSTHILDDVQRISDHVIILRQGAVIAQGPMQALLHHGQHSSYSITLTGASGATVSRLKQQSWIHQIHKQTINGAQQWQISVHDDEYARRDLLRLILKDEDVRVLSFRQDGAELEDVFMQLVNGESTQ